MSTRAAGLAGAGAVGLVALLLVDPPLGRLALAGVACLVLPGLGWARKMRLGDPGDTLALTLVLSVCATVGVGTAMALASAWSVGGGLAALGLVALSGFIPGRALAGDVAAGLRRWTEPGGDDVWASWQFDVQVRQRQAAIAAREASDVWVDWYTDVERRAEEAQAREAAAAQRAAEEWVAWQQRTQTRTHQQDSQE